MTYRKRLATLEQKDGGPEPLIVFFKTFYEGKDGGIESEYCSATIIEGRNKGTNLQRDISETFEQFSTRAVKVAATRRSVAMTGSGDTLV